MAKRSPILGYNHNISHRGLVFHVQTEDSGVEHPHIFTHLFYGGVIVNTRKLDYDAEAAEETVKSLMQAQHKAALKLLKRGEFDDKIDQYFGDNPELEPRNAKGGAVAKAAPPEESAGTRNEKSDVSAAFDAIQDGESAPPQAAAPAPPAATPRAAAPVTPVPEAGAPTPVAPSASGAYVQRGLPPERITAQRAAARPPVVIHDQPTMPVQRARAVATRPSGKMRRLADRLGEAGRRPPASSVVVSRPAVIIGAPSKVVGGKAAAPAAARPRGRRFAREEAANQGLFGRELISEKSLDEVILAYLSEDSSEE